LHETMTAESRTECRRTAEPRDVLGRMVPSYLALFEVRLTALILLTTAAGFVAGSAGPIEVPLLLRTLLGTGLCAAGAHALNQWAERSRDVRMERTRERPLPAGRLTPRHALCAATLALLPGLGLLVSQVNPLTALLGALCVALYFLVYTPLKSRTPWCTLIGAICGAIPPMMGWTGTAGALGAGAWVLGGLLFFWQIPHFLALAWLYRDDYARGGFCMLPAHDRTGRRTGIIVVLGLLVLLPWGPAMTILGLSGGFFAAGSVVLGAGMLVLGVRMSLDRSERNARSVFLGSVLYLPLLLGLLIANR
jgi:heme o synthase